MIGETEVGAVLVGWVTVDANPIGFGGDGAFECTCTGNTLACCKNEVEVEQGKIGMNEG